MQRRRFCQSLAAAATAGGIFSTPLSARAAAMLKALPVGAGDGSVAPLLAEAGYGYLELSFSNMVDPRIDEAAFAKKLEEIKSYALPAQAMNGFLPGGDYPITGPDPKHDAIIEWSKVGFERAKRAGVAVVTIGSGGARKVPDGFDPAKARDQFSQLLGRIGPIARDAGVVAAIENLNRGETNLGNTAEECFSLVTNSGSPDVAVTVDIFHMLRENEGPEMITKAGPRVVHCHVAEKGNRTQPGFAGDDFRPYLEAMAGIGYQGRFTFECRWDGGIEKGAAAAIQAFRAQMG